jgi:hypothetical protein
MIARAAITGYRRSQGMTLPFLGLRRLIARFGEHGVGVKRNSLNRMGGNFNRRDVTASLSESRQFGQPGGAVVGHAGAKGDGR